MSDVVALRLGAYRGDPSHADLPLLLLTPALFAGNMVAARLAESIGIPPLFLACGRWGLAFLLLLPFVAARLWAWRRVLLTHWPQVLLLAGLGMAGAVAPQYIGARETSAANIALIFAACPVLVILIETVVWHVRPPPRRLLGMLAAIGGILVVLSKGEPATLAHLRFGRGDLWVLAAAGSWAAYTVMSKRSALPPLPCMVRLAALIGGGAVVLAPFALLEVMSGSLPDFSDGRLYLMLCFLGIVPSLGAYFCYDRLVGMVGAGGASVSMYVVPIYAALAAWLLLGEAPQMFHAFGFMAILGGVVLSGSDRAV